MSRFTTGRIAFVAAVMILGATGVFTTPARAAVTLVVDDDGKATAANCGAVTPTFATITAAVTAASPGDTVKVCPGVYNENVDVDKPITLIGAKVGVNGFTRVFSVSSESIIQTGSFSLSAVSVFAHGVVVDGFTMQQSQVGVYTDPLYSSGFVIRNNIIRNNVIGVSLHSDGSSPSLVTRNKILANNKGFDNPAPPFFAGVGILTYFGLSNATVTGNFIGSHRDAATFLANCFIDEGVSSNLTISSNTMQNNSSAVVLAGNTTAVTISKNTINDTSDDLVGQPQIWVGSGNTNIIIGGATDANGNTITNAPADGIVIGDFGNCLPEGILPPGGVSVGHNTVSNSGAVGVGSTSSVAQVVVHGNHLTNAGVYGIFFADETAGNSISGNAVSGSGLLDCFDDSTGGPAGSPNFGTQNSWTLNTGGSDDPDGICPPPAP